MDVVVVEDEPLIREAVAAELREAGFEVAGFAAAEEALAWIADGQREPDILVTDLHLGSGMNGLDLGAAFRRLCPDLHVVYATAYPSDLEGRILSPRERYLLKPYEPAAILQVVRRAMPMFRL